MAFNLGMQHRMLEYYMYQVCSNDDPGLQQGQIWSLMLLYGEKGKTMDFSEIILVYDIKVGRCSQLT